MNKIYINVPVKITNYELIKELNDKYCQYNENLYLLLEGNSKYVSLSLCYKTLEEIKKVTDYVKSLNLSHLESIMIVYDILKEKMYQKEEKEEEYLKSRDISEILFGNYIVCVGYSRLFNAILTNLGIECFDVDFIHKNDKKGHVRNLVYIDDQKYNIEGYYYFDITRDSKQDEFSNIYKYRYNFFAKNTEEINKLDCGKYETNCRFEDILASESLVIKNDSYIKILELVKRVENKYDPFEIELTKTLSNWK